MTAASGPTTSEVSVPSLHTDDGVTERQYYTAVHAAPLTFARREATGGSHGTP
jgi:hypothetical protein